MICVALQAPHRESMWLVALRRKRCRLFAVLFLNRISCHQPLFQNRNSLFEVTCFDRAKEQIHQRCQTRCHPRLKFFLDVHPLATSTQRRLSQHSSPTLRLAALYPSSRSEAAYAAEFNRRRAVFVLGKIDEILAWEQRKETERDTKFVELGRYLSEVRAGQFWRVTKVRRKRGIWQLRESLWLAINMTWLAV